MKLGFKMKIRSKEHLQFVCRQPCIITGNLDETNHAHHLLRVEGKGLATKTCDSWTVPLHWTLHNALHKNGNEIAFFANHGLDYETVKQIARDLSNKSPDKRIREINNLTTKGE